VGYKAGEVTVSMPDLTAANSRVQLRAIKVRLTDAISRMKMDANSTSKFKVGTRLTIYGR
jgi:hypothetical protein